MNQRKQIKNLRVAWQSPANIALVKYWGKHGVQLPVSPSLSFSLKHSVSESSIEVFPGGEGKAAFFFEGALSPFGKRVEAWLELLAGEVWWIRKVNFRIESHNSFPHSAGIASSASAFASLAMCIAEIDQLLEAKEYSPSDLQARASHWARLGSGSASRSVYGGFSLWGQTNLFESSSDQYAIPLQKAIHPSFQGLKDAVLIVDSGSKSVSSSQGHQLMQNHPFKRQRIAQAHEHLYSQYLSLLTGDKQAFLENAEAEALALHALMMTSHPPFLLLKPNSIAIIEKIKQFRTQTQIPLGFTIDAGPNIHLLYFLTNKTEVQTFIERELTPYCENRRWIDDGIGDGPVKTA